MIFNLADFFVSPKAPIIFLRTLIMLPKINHCSISGVHCNSGYIAVRNRFLFLGLVGAFLIIYFGL